MKYGWFYFLFFIHCFSVVHAQEVDRLVLSQVDSLNQIIENNGEENRQLENRLYNALRTASPETQYIAFNALSSYATAFLSHHEGIYYSSKAATIALDLQDSVRYLQALRKKVVLFGMNGQVDSANHIVTDAIQYLLTKQQSPPYDSLLAYYWVNYGNILYLDESKHEAIKAYRKANRIFETIHDTSGIVLALVNIGAVYDDFHENDSIIWYFNRVLKYNERGGVSAKQMQIAYNNLGVTYVRLKYFDKGIEYYKKSLQIERQIAGVNGDVLQLNNIASAYIDANRMHLARLYADSALVLLSGVNNLHFKASVFRNMALIYEKLHMPDTALSYYKQFLNLSDSIRSHQKINTSASLILKEKSKEVLVKNVALQEKVEELILVRRVIVFLSGIILVLGVYILRRFSLYKRLNMKLMGHQKDLVEAKIRSDKNYSFYKNLVKYNHDAIFILKDGKVVFANPKAEEILGYESENLEGQDFLKFIVPRDRVKFEAALEMAYEDSSGACNVSIRQMDKDNETHYLDGYVKLIDPEESSVMFSGYDKSDVLYTRHLLESRLIRYRRVVEATTDGTWELDTDTKEIYFSSNWKSLLGYLPKITNYEDIRFFSNVVYHQDIDPLLQAFKNCISGDAPTFVLNIQIQNDEKEYRWFQVRGGLVKKMGHNGADRVVGTVHDIQRLKEAEQAMVEKESQLQEANQAKDKFFSIIAHDLKSPFNAILGFADLLYKEYGSFDDDEKKHFVENIYRSSESAYQLLENLLTWSRAQNNRIEFLPETLDLGKIVHNVVRLNKQKAIQKEVDIKSTVPAIEVHADENMLQTVLHNLISNAIKFTNKNKGITIAAKESKDFVVVHILDQGVGIPEKELGNLFRIDQQYRRKGTSNETGTGLGLLLCKEFITKHGGTIHVASVLGEGSDFYFTIPLAIKKDQA